MVRKWNVWGGALLALCTGVAAPVVARPPDLPLPVEQECQPSQPPACPTAASAEERTRCEAMEAIVVEMFRRNHGGNPQANGSQETAVEQLCQEVLQFFPCCYSPGLSACKLFQLVQLFGCMPPAAGTTTQVEPIAVPLVPCGDVNGQLLPCPTPLMPVASYTVSGGSAVPVQTGYPMPTPPVGTYTPPGVTDPAPAYGVTPASWCPEPVPAYAPMPYAPMPTPVTGGAPMPAMMPGNTLPMCLPPVVDPNAVVSPTTPESMQQMTRARQFFDIAEFYARTGQLATAHQYYQEAHISDPAGSFGQGAMARMQQIEAQMTWRSRPDFVPVAVQTVPPQSAGDVDYEQSSVVPVGPPTESEQFLVKLAQAQEMYHIGERCRTRGDLDMAYSCYHEAERICPDSDYAHLAAAQIRHIDILREIEGPQGETPSGDGDLEEPASENIEDVTPTPADAQDVLPLFLPFLPELFGVYEQPTRERTEECICPAQEVYGTGRASECTTPAGQVIDLNLGFMGIRLERAAGSAVEENEGDCVRQRARMARAAETAAWVVQAMNFFGGNGTRIDLDVDNSGANGLRVRGGLSFGMIGCQVIVDGDNCRIVWPGME